MSNRFAEMVCPTCDISFKIKLESNQYIPDERFLFCPICGSIECKARWIDHDKTNYNGENGSNK
jgi:hypothetical protein